MTNHVHLIVSATVPARLDEIVRDLKRHTSGKLRKAIRENPQESRKSWITWMLEKEGTFNNNNIDWQLWQQHNHPIQLSTMEMARQRLNYLHENPVRAGFVSQADHWRWGSAFDYNGGKGPIDILYLF